jgi:hypothetical protein
MTNFIELTANPDHPESALNAIPKAVLQHARGLAVFQVSNIPRYPLALT